MLNGWWMAVDKLMAKVFEVELAKINKINNDGPLILCLLSCWAPAGNGSYATSMASVWLALNSGKVHEEHPVLSKNKSSANNSWHTNNHKCFTVVKRTGYVLQEKRTFFVFNSIWLKLMDIKLCAHCCLYFTAVVNYLKKLPSGLEGILISSICCIFICFCLNLCKLPHWC